MNSQSFTPTTASHNEFPRSNGRRNGFVAVFIALLVALALLAPPRAGAQLPEGTLLIPGSSWFGGRGVAVCANGDGYASGCNSVANTSGLSEWKWQCVELAQRFYRDRGWTARNQFVDASGTAIAAAYQITDVAPSNGLVSYANNGSYKPVPGDLIVENPTSGNWAGHVSVVNSVSNDAITVVEQNRSDSGWNSYRWTSGGVQANGGGSIRGIVHSPKNSTEAPTSTPSSTGFYRAPGFVSMNGDVPIVGDWNGDGIDEAGVVRGNTFFLRNWTPTRGFYLTSSFNFGNGIQKGDVPIVGDWNGDGIDEVGVARGNSFILRNWTPSRGHYGTSTFNFGNGISAGDVPIVGDWNRDGIDEVGVVRGNEFILRQWSPSRGYYATPSFRFGNGTGAGDLPVVGDWNGDGIDEVGISRNDSIHRRHSDSAFRQTSTSSILYGNGTTAGNIFITGDWDGNGTDEIGVVQSARFNLRNSNGSTNAFNFGNGTSARVGW